MIDIKLLDKNTYDYLKEDGWYEDREIDISEWITQLENDGYRIFPYAELILKTLGGLYIRPDATFGMIRSGEINFDPLDIGIGEFWHLEKYESKVGEKLYPLGLYLHLYVYVGESKKIYVIDRDIYFAGKNIEESLNNILLGKVLVKICLD